MLYVSLSLIDFLCFLSFIFPFFYFSLSFFSYQNQSIFCYENVVRLSDSMGLNGQGKLQVWNPILGKWDEMCGEDWQVPEQSEQVCRLLGYQSSNETRLQDETSDLPRQRQFHHHQRSPKPLRFSSLLNRQEDKCRDSDTSVHIKCHHFECGRSSHFHQRRRRNTRIVGGEESYPGKWPWLVSFHGGPAEVFFCAGVLISEWWVLTAAHCIGT